MLRMGPMGPMGFWDWGGEKSAVKEFFFFFFLQSHVDFSISSSMGNGRSAAAVDVFVR